MRAVSARESEGCVGEDESDTEIERIAREALEIAISAPPGTQTRYGVVTWDRHDSWLLLVDLLLMPRVRDSRLDALHDEAHAKRGPRPDGPDAELRATIARLEAEVRTLREPEGNQ